MKKMKIMLLSFALLAIVGGALAFKVKNTRSYCTAPTESDGTCVLGSGSNKTCPNGLIQLTTADLGDRFTYCYTTPLANRSDCKKANGTDDLQCISTSTSFREADPIP